jgi:hypothetical protein
MKPRIDIRFLALAAAGALTALTVGFVTQPADAAIRCEGNFQITSYGRINTPYCEDVYLAQVAREYGMRVSNQAVLRNPSVKERACRFVGNDIRVKSTCQRYLPENNNRFWR